MRFLTFALLFASVASGAEPQAYDGLDELNKQRAARGLKPYQHDDGLTLGAAAAAVYRADHNMAGHTGNDFAFLPAGIHANAAGCAKWSTPCEFGACAAYENWTYAGAAWVVKGNQRFMHLFVSNRKQSTATVAAPTSVNFREAAKPAAPVKAGMVHCTMYDGKGFAKSNILKEWDEPEPAGGCPGGNCNAKQMPAIQPGCASGNCPNARR